MPDHPSLSEFRRRLDGSSADHRSVIAPTSSEIHKDGMNETERRRVVDESAAQIRRAMGGA